MAFKEYLYFGCSLVLRQYYCAPVVAGHPHPRELGLLIEAYAGHQAMLLVEPLSRFVQVPTPISSGLQRSVLEHPRSRRWRITHETHCWVREAPVLNSKRLDLRPPGDIVEVSAELDGEGGERWVRLALAFANSTSGFMLIDGSSYGFGKLLEPLNDESPATLERKTPIAASPPPSTRSRPQAAPQQMSAPPHAPPSLIDVLVHAGIADGVASSYPAKLRDASDGAIGDLVSELTCSTEELGAACRRAKLPMGHRLGIVNALGKLRRAAGHI